MSTSTIYAGFVDPAAVLDRHATRRNTGVPTVSILVGPIGGGLEIWRRWAAGTRRSVIVSKGPGFPYGEWLRSVAEEADLPGAAVDWVAGRLGRDRDELLAAGWAKTPADRDRFWASLAPDPDNDLLRALATFEVEGLPSSAAASLSGAAKQVVPMIGRLVTGANLPSVVFVAGSIGSVSAAGHEAVAWAMRVPRLPLAIAVPGAVWEEYLKSAPDSRTKTILKEGTIAVPAIPKTKFEQALKHAGVPAKAFAALAPHSADGALLDAAVAAAEGIRRPPKDSGENDRARSAAERFLFRVLESMPETAGRFELNALLDFSFGGRPAEVDLLCRSARIVIELDGYFHFLVSENYRRDRAKDWELQRRGFVVLRFLAEDVVAEFEMIRDRILDALTLHPSGASP
jgi:hypothetical protein